MRTIQTNSDLYQAVVELGRSEAARRRPLAEYLRAFWSAGYDLCDAPALKPAEFMTCLAAALESPAPAFDRGWLWEDLSIPDHADPFAAWARTLRAQICDLQEMTAAGVYDEQARYLGVTAPRPHGVNRRPTADRWCNFEVGSYLECGVVGAFGGWRPEFEDAEVDAEPAAPVPLTELGWADLTRFALCGQSHD